MLQVVWRCVVTIPLCEHHSLGWGKQENGSGHSHVISSSFTSVDIVHRESKRKTAAIMSLRNDERLFGDAALSTVSCTAFWPDFGINISRRV